MIAEKEGKDFIYVLDCSSNSTSYLCVAKSFVSIQPATWLLIVADAWRIFPASRMDCTVCTLNKKFISLLLLTQVKSKTIAAYCNCFSNSLVSFFLQANLKDLNDLVTLYLPSEAAFAFLTTLPRINNFVSHVLNALCVIPFVLLLSLQKEVDTLDDQLNLLEEISEPRQLFQRIGNISQE